MGALSQNVRGLVLAEAAAGGSRGLSALLLTYPVHQAADIQFSHGNLVPVGRDQLPHIELTRLIARRFNERYASGAPIFRQPDALLTAAPSLLGTDGTKMSKSRSNTIALGDDEDRTAALLRRAKTDSERTITYDPERRPEVSNLLLIAALCPRRHRAEGVGHRGGQRDATTTPSTPPRARHRPGLPPACPRRRERARQ